MSAFLYRPKDPARKPFVFVHIPKTGGTSLRGGVLANIPVAGKLLGPHATPRQPWPWARSFTILREPRERFLSGWAERAPQWPIEKVLEVLYNPEIAADDPEGGVAQNVKHHLVSLTHAQNAVLVQRARLRLYTHRLEHDWPEVVRRLRLGVETRLPRLRAKPARRTWRELTARERAKIETYLQLDLELWANSLLAWS